MRIATFLCALMLLTFLGSAAHCQTMVSATISNPIEGEQYEHDKAHVLCLGTCSGANEPIVIKLIRPNGSVHDDETVYSGETAPDHQWGAHHFYRPETGWPEFGDWKVKIYHNGLEKDEVTFKIKAPPTGPPGPP